jgi:C-terminal processing protease CtpA/Prc
MKANAWRAAIGAGIAAGSLVLAACTAGEVGQSRPGTGNDSPRTGATPTQLARKCAPANPYAHDAAGRLLNDYVEGTLSGEKAWVAAYMNQAYLWYREIPQVDANAAPYGDADAHYASVDAYFRALRTKAINLDGSDKDRFSFTYPTADYNRLLQAGVIYGYGVEWRNASNTPPRNIRAAYVEAGTSGAQAGILRGDRLVSAKINDTTIAVDTTVPAQLELLSEALSPSQNGQVVELELKNGTGVTRRVSVVGGQVTTRPLFLTDVLAIGGERIGYMVVNDFIAPAEAPLVAAIERFRDQSINDLILDLRYNGGGYVDLASELGYMIAGAARSSGRVFESYQYNDKRIDENRSVFFLEATTGSEGSGTTPNQPLPQLDLQRVIVLSTASTCSASEALVNGLRGIGITAILVGARTCGKPYGSVPTDNCGISYFPIEFQGVNANGFGNYAGGIEVSCPANDDLNRQLGDRNEGLLAAALAYRVNGTCPALEATAKDAGGELPEGRLIRPPVREGRYLRAGPGP